MIEIFLELKNRCYYYNPLMLIFIIDIVGTSSYGGECYALTGNPLSSP
jgi:hypothetical protein